MDLVFQGVTKLYGPVIGVNDINCRVGPGITGLFGANGAGKSTMLKLASGQLRPTLGSVRLGSHPAWSATAKRSLGYSPDVNSFYEEMTGREFVVAMTRLYGYSKREALERANAALAAVDMTSRAERRIAGCSHGMRQRIKLAQAMANDPLVVLLDEPMTGIDPGGRREISDLLFSLAARGKTILVSSHLLSEIENLADQMLMIARGRIIASGTIHQVRELIAEQPFTVEVLVDDPRPLASRLLALSMVEAVEVRARTLIVRTRQTDLFFTRLGQLVLEHDCPVRGFQVLDGGADAVFGYLEQGMA